MTRRLVLSLVVCAVAAGAALKGLTTTTTTAAARIVVIGDVHGAGEPFAAMLKRAGLIYTKQVEQLFDPVKGMFLADRYVQGECPVCGAGRMRVVSYVYGDKLKTANGRCIANDTELARLGSTCDEFACFDVEVCVDCRWNYLRRQSLHGRLHAS